ncbi:MAG: hypothetical protein JNK04_11070 [Myxococcales bacterium]|nr:hypothetical protein [Myxococcales bacterium]
MRLFCVSGAVLLFSMAVVACGGGPGGTVGPPCSDLGKDDPNCLSDEICDEIETGERYCLYRCNDHSDCASGERCNGTKKGKDKACHPQFEDDCREDHPDFPDC